MNTSAEALQYRAMLLAFGQIGEWMKAVRRPAPAGPLPRWSAETAREWDRKYQWPEDSRRRGEGRVLKGEESAS